MNRNNRTVVDILVIFVLMAVISVIVYFGGNEIVLSSSDSGLVKAEVWKEYHSDVVFITGTLAGLVLLGWYVLARFVLKVRQPGDGSKRVLWMAFFGLAAAVSIFVPFVIKLIKADKISGTGVVLSGNFNIVIPILFFVFYALIGYWVGSLLVTPAPYKYVPVGAKLVKKPRAGK